MAERNEKEAHKNELRQKKMKNKEVIAIYNDLQDACATCRMIV